MDEPRLKPRLKPDTGMSPDSTLSTDIGMSPDSSIIKPGNDKMIDEMFEACRLDEVFRLTNEENQDLLKLNAELENMLDLQNTLRTPPPSLNISPLQCHALQNEELEVLKAIYDEDLLFLNEDCTCFCVKIRFLSDEIKDEDVIRIWFSLPHNYPCVPPVLEIETNQSGSFTFADADNLFDQLMQTAITRLGSTMIYDLITQSQDLMPGLIQRKKEETQIRKDMEEERRKDIELNDALRSKKKGFIPDKLWSDLIANSEFETKEEEEQEEEGMSFVSSGKHYHPKLFVGSISNIIQKLPSSIQITRIENILRQDLADRFDKCHSEMVNTLWKKERQNPKMFSLQPQIAFHGTLTKSLPSIVQHGLVIPGKQNKIQVRCGSSLGKGIYLSPSAEFSLGYTDSSRLIVCAVLLGRMYKGEYDGQYSKHHVFISSSEYEWVFFNAAQVLPCYVIQVKSMPSSTGLRGPVPPPLIGVVNKEDNIDEHEKYKREKLQARARKFLPYGFGPGNKTIILECGEIDDDEEDYGDYQLLRHTEMESDYNRHDVFEEKTELQEYRTLEKEDLG